MYISQTKSPRRLAKQRDREIAKLPPWARVIRGTLHKHQRPCGRAGCRCKSSPRYHHGPYWYVAVSVKGKTKLAHIPSNQLSRIRRDTKAYHRLWEGLCRISEINLALVKAGV